MTNDIIIRISKKDGYYDWVGSNLDGKIYMWGAAHEDPFEMLDTIKGAVAEDMYQSGWRKYDTR